MVPFTHSSPSRFSPGLQAKPMCRPPRRRYPTRCVLASLASALFCFVCFVYSIDDLVGHVDFDSWGCFCCFSVPLPPSVQCCRVSCRLISVVHRRFAISQNPHKRIGALYTPLPPARLNLLHFPVPPLVCLVSFVRLYPPPVFAATPAPHAHACWSLFVTTSHIADLTHSSSSLSLWHYLSFFLSFARHFVAGFGHTPHSSLPACVRLRVHAVCALFVLSFCPVG
jgi:hypothetical protein